MRRLRIVLALAVLPGLALASWLHWSELQEARATEERARSTRADLDALRARAPEDAAEIAALVTARARLDTLTGLLEGMRRWGGSPAAALVTANRTARELRITVDSAWARGGFVEMTGRAPDRRAATLLGQALEEEGHVTDVDLWRLEPDGRFTLLARLPKAPAR